MTPQWGKEGKVCGKVRWMRSSPGTPIRRIRVLKSTESSRRGSKPPTWMCVSGRRRRASSGASAGESKGSIQSVSEHVKTCNSEYGLWAREARDKARDRDQWQSANPAAVVPAGRYEEVDSGPEDDEVDA